MRVAKELKENSLKEKKRFLNPILSGSGITKHTSWAEAIYNEAGMFYPEKADWRKRLVHTLFEWVKRPDTLLLEDFCMEYGICRPTLYIWGRKYEDIGRALDNVKIFIGARRRKGVIKNELNGVFAYKDMHVYDPDWEKVNAYHANLQAEARAKAAQDLAVTNNKEYIMLRCDCKKTCNCEKNKDTK